MTKKTSYDFDGVQRITVIGGCESGVGAAVLAKDKGFEIKVSDFGKIPEKYVAELQRENIAYEQGGHTMDEILASDLIIKSPGVPLTAPVIKAAVEKGIPVISEIEFAGAFTDAKMVCITGSNGKTTTTLLTYHILKSAGIDAGLAGNVGNSLALQVARDPHEVYVIELSSFQLDNMYRFKADIAVITNITPDHLDRYDFKMENYVSAKFRILQNQTDEDTFIYWQDDPVIAERLPEVSDPAKRLPFAEKEEKGTAAYVDGDGYLVIKTPVKSLKMKAKDLSLPGVHNLKNSMCAGLIACTLCVEPEVTVKALGDLAPVEHRLEPAGTVDGAKWVNDSKATNVDSCWYALDSMTTPVVLILGGKDKGNDYNQILPLVKEKVHAIVAMGLHNEKIMEFFSPVVKTVSTDSLEKAVKACRELANPGDTVLLSPCCASFDLFTSYEDRGRKFKAAVREMEKA